MATFTVKAEPRLSGKLWNTSTLIFKEAFKTGDGNPKADIEFARRRQDRGELAQNAQMVRKFLRTRI